MEKQLKSQHISLSKKKYQMSSSLIQLELENISDFFDADYFINGKSTGKSLYENYRWLPELTNPMAEAIIKFLQMKPGNRVLDYGCAKGYLVKALRNKGINAFGCDISTYAIKNADPCIKKYLTVIDNECLASLLPKITGQNFDFIIAKDVFEHIPKTKLKELLKLLLNMTSKIYAVVPLAENNRYRISDYERDKSHLIREDESWWKTIFLECGFRKVDYSFKVDGVKDAALELHQKGNGHFKIMS